MLKKPFSLINPSRLALFLAFCGVAMLYVCIEVIYADQMSESIPPYSPEELLSELVEQENKLVNLRVRSELWQQRRVPDSNEWETTPVYTSCTAWFDGQPQGKARIDVHKQVLEWQDGPAPFAESAFSAGFDTRQGRVAYHKDGPLGQSHSRGKGVISPKAPHILRGAPRARSSGAAFSTFFVFNELGKRFSDILSQAISQGVSIEITWEAIQGIDCIKLGSGQTELGHETYWLDPARGYALLRHERTKIGADGRELVVALDKIVKVSEAAPGIWYPVEVYSESTWSSDPNTQQTDVRFHYLASEVLANDPNFDESVFTLTFPAGYRIDDKVNGVTYKVGSPLEKLVDTLDQVVDEASRVTD